MATRKTTTATTETIAKPEQSEQTKPVFSKEQILASDRYANRRDLVDALLANDSYTIDTVDKLIEEYMKGQVK